jgi:hypothetical protein
MFQLYCILKDCGEMPTPNEIAIASGKMELDGHAEAEYLKKLQKALENIKKAFEDQKAQAAISDNYLLEHLVLMDRSTGSMGPGKVQAGPHGMDHCM